MEDGILSLKWNNHNATFIETLSTLLKVDLYSDVTLACEGQYFSVHKLILSICSEYFQEILSRTKCQHPVIVLKDIKHTDLEALLNYMYSGEANVAQNDLSSLIKAAECLRIKGLALPDEATPVRERKRYIDRDGSGHINKKRRSDDSLSSHSHKIIRNLDTNKVTDLVKRTQNIYNKCKQHTDEVRQPDDDILSEEGNLQTIPEILLEDASSEVKQEVHETKVEEDTEGDIRSPGFSLGYGQVYLDDSTNGEKLQGHDYEPSHGLSEIISHTVAGTSGIHGESSWESSSSSVAGFNENFSQEESTSQQMGFENLKTKDEKITEPSSIELTTSYTNNPVPGPRQCCWICPYRECKYTTDRSSSLTKHIRKHTGEKPFACPYCPYSSAQKSNLTSHIKQRHLAPYHRMRKQV